MDLRTETFDKSALEAIISSGSHNSRIDMAGWGFYFDMASTGDEAEAELWAVRKGGGLNHGTLRQCAVIAKSLTKIATKTGMADFSILKESDVFQEKFKFVSGLQPAYLNFLWEAYSKFRAEQEARFAKFLESGDAKKSSPNQNTETTGEPSASAAV